MAIISGSGHAEPSAPDRLILVSKKSYERTVQQLQWELGGYGMTTVTALDYGKILKTNKPAGVRGVVFEVLRRQWATAALKQDPAAILEMPLRIAVYSSRMAKPWSVATGRHVDLPHTAMMNSQTWAEPWTPSLRRSSAGSQRASGQAPADERM